MPTSVDISIPKNGVVSTPCPMTNRISHSRFHLHPLPGKVSGMSIATGTGRVTDCQGRGQHQSHDDKPCSQYPRGYRQRDDLQPPG